MNSDCFAILNFKRWQKSKINRINKILKLLHTNKQFPKTVSINKIWTSKIEKANFLGNNYRLIT